MARSYGKRCKLKSVNIRQERKTNEIGINYEQNQKRY